MGSHWESNPRPPTLAVDALTTELQLPCSNPVLSLSLSLSLSIRPDLKNKLSLNEEEGRGN